MQPGFESRWKFHWCLASNTEMESRKRYSAASFITRCCILPRLRWKFQEAAVVSYDSSQAESAGHAPKDEETTIRKTADKKV